MRARLIILFLMLFLSASISRAAEYSLTIQPILSEDKTQEAYQPLADYLSSQTGQTITLITHRNFTFYWNKMRNQQQGFDLVLDAAHFTDYRVKKQGYQVLAKLPDTVSFSIVSHEDNFYMDADELTSKRIATMPSPSLGAMRLQELYPNPMRVPIYIYERNTRRAVDSVLSGKVDAAIIPTRLVAEYSGLNTVETTEPVPHMALSASAEVPTDIVEKIRTALLTANTTPEGQKMLAAINATKFEAADSTTYDGYSKLLEGVFGY